MKLRSRPFLGPSGRFALLFSLIAQNVPFLSDEVRRSFARPAPSVRKPPRSP